MMMKYTTYVGPAANAECYAVRQSAREARVLQKCESATDVVHKCKFSKQRLFSYSDKLLGLH